MNTLQRFAAGVDSIPTSTSWYLADLGEAKGLLGQLRVLEPERLESLRAGAVVESAVSSNRIEGVEADPGRVPGILFGRRAFRDRDEEEIRGYREALTLIHTKGAKFELDEALLLRLHAMIRGEIADAGRYKTRDIDIIERYPDGRERVRFRAVTAAQSPAAMKDLLADARACLAERWTHPLIALAVFNLDFLCVHPFRDGNGRVSRLLFLLQAVHAGHEIGRYVSLERLIEYEKERYYETLEASSLGWHEGRNDPWPYVNFTLSILKSAYREVEERLALAGGGKPSSRARKKKG